MIERLTNIPAALLRESRANGLSYAAGWLLSRLHLRFVRPRIASNVCPNSDDLKRPLTIVIPAVEKDAALLVECLRSVKTYLRNPIQAVWIVAPESLLIRSIARDHGYEFVHEDQILPAPAKSLATRGWVIQQLIKFNASAHVPTEDYLVLDADTVFLRPQFFFRGGKTVLRYSDQYELLYNRSLSLVFGHNRRFPVSFVTHHMVFNREAVQALLSHMEKQFDCTWWNVILSQLDNDTLISFSEFELYGHFIINSPGWHARHRLEYWHGIDMPNADPAQLAALTREQQASFNTVSMHRHTQ